MIERWTAGWRGDEEERAASAAGSACWLPIICLAYAFGYSVIAFDQVMSLSPDLVLEPLRRLLRLGRLSRPASR